MAVTSSTEREPDLERQRARIEAEFRAGWVPRNVAQPDDPLLPTERQPFIDGVGDDVEVIIVGDAPPWVAVLFSHERFPGVRFGHRIRAPSSELARYATVWLKEEVETGALHRMMRSQPPPDDAGIIWTSWRGNR